MVSLSNLARKVDVGLQQSLKIIMMIIPITTAEPPIAIVKIIPDDNVKGVAGEVGEAEGEKVLVVEVVVIVVIVLLVVKKVELIVVGLFDVVVGGTVVVVVVVGITIVVVGT